MKLALFADIHSNLEAITACLAHAQALGADRYAFLGDLVGYGADPVAVLDLIEQHAANGAVVVLGNHDAAAIGRPDDSLNDNAQAAIAWTRDQLGKRQRAFLAGLPLTIRDDNILFVHASAAAPERWTYVTGPAERTRCIKGRHEFAGPRQRGRWFPPGRASPRRQHGDNLSLDRARRSASSHHQNPAPRSR